MKKILEWLGIQDALEKGLLARILVILCLLFICFGAVFVATRIVLTLLPGYPDAHWTDLLIESVIFFIGLITLRFIRSDQLQTASRLILSGLLFIVTLQAYFLGDPANDIAGALGLLLFAFLAIVLLDRADRWIAIGLVIAAFIGLNILSASGILLPVITLTPLGKVIFTFFVWFSVGSIIALILIAAMGAMRREPHLLNQQIDEALESQKGAKGTSTLPYISTHDALTGLYNRLFFETEINRLEKSRLYPISIIMVDLDELKKINEAFGYRAGDQMLIDIARLLAKVFRQDEIITRYGEDEFVVLLPNSNESIVALVTNRIKERVIKFNKEHPKMPVSISLGHSTANRGDSLKTHLKHAMEQVQKEKLKKL